MRSVTSFFNFTLYRKNITRFWPLWVLYLFCGICSTSFLLLQRWMDYEGYEQQLERVLSLAQDFPEIFPALVWIAAGYCLLCAMAVFSYLYNSRSACGIHVLPVRRETLFWTNYLSGVTFFLIPNLIIAALMLVVELCLFPSHLWSETLPVIGVLLVVTTSFEWFFFSFSSLCAMLTGHILALPVFYGVFNGLVLLIYALLQLLFQQSYYGFRSASPSALVEWLTPIYQLMKASVWVDYNLVSDGYDGYSHVAIPFAEQHLISPFTLVVYVVAGIVLTLVALALYRLRHIESAGDVVAFPAFYPLFRCGVAFCGGLTLGVGMIAFFQQEHNAILSIAFLLFWGIISYFVAEMLLQKSFRVWNQWRNCAAFTAVCLILCVLAYSDFLGVETRIPQADQIERVSVYISPSQPEYLPEFELTGDMEQIDTILKAHQTVIEHRNEYQYWRLVEPYQEIAYFRITYYLNDGSDFSRSYDFPLYRAYLTDDTRPEFYFTQLMEDGQVLRRAYQIDKIKSQTLSTILLEYPSGQADGHWISHEIEEKSLLWEALKRDFEEGNLVEHRLFYNEEDSEDPDVIASESAEYSTATEPAVVTKREDIVDTVYSHARIYLDFIKQVPTGEPGEERSIRIHHLDFRITARCRHTLAALNTIGIHLNLVDSAS